MVRRKPLCQIAVLMIATVRPRCRRSVVSWSVVRRDTPENCSYAGPTPSLPSDQKMNRPPALWATEREDPGITNAETDRSAAWRELPTAPQCGGILARRAALLHASVPLGSRSDRSIGSSVRYRGNPITSLSLISAIAESSKPPEVGARSGLALCGHREARPLRPLLTQSGTSRGSLLTSTEG